MKPPAPPKTSPVAISRSRLWTTVAANLIPVVGVLALGWNAFAIVFLYWLENAVVGAFNVPRIAMARAPEPRRAVPGESLTREQADRMGKGCMIPFFLVHYGVFMLVHGMFVLVLFGGLFGQARHGGLATGHTLSETALWYLVALAGLAVSHGYAFLDSYVRGREYERLSPSQAMFSPYPRIVVLHVAILFGAFLAAALRDPIPVLVLLVVGKTLAELSLARRAAPAG